MQTSEVYIWHWKTVSLVNDSWGIIEEQMSDMVVVIEKDPTGTPPVLKTPSNRSSPLHTFTALDPSLATILAPRRTPAVPSPVGNSNQAISISTSVGFHPLSTTAYSKYVQALRPDIAVSLADVAYGQKAGVKRLEMMGDRTIKFLDSLIYELKEQEFSETAIFAPVLPIDIRDQWEYLEHIADELTDSISGLAFYSSSLIPFIPATTAILQLPRLSLDKPSSPHEILRQIHLGMDIFTIPFLGFATDAGLGLTFQFPPPASKYIETTNRGPHPLAIDHFSSALATTTAPITPHCSCYTCTAHHTAYITHLLSANEMLGWVLLQIHNHHTMSAFFAGVRASIAAGTFEQDCDAFATFYDPALPEGTGEKPRIRGYHFRSEGPGEPKRNKPAWGNLGGADTPLVPDANARGLKERGFAEAVDRE